MTPRILYRRLFLHVRYLLVEGRMDGGLAFRGGKWRLVQYRITVQQQVFVFDFLCPSPLAIHTCFFFPGGWFLAADEKRLTLSWKKRTKFMSFSIKVPPPMYCTVQEGFGLVSLSFLAI